MSREDFQALCLGTISIWRANLLLDEQKYLSPLALHGAHIGTEVKTPLVFARGAVVQTSKSIGVAPTVYLSL